MRTLILVCLLIGFIDELHAQGQQQNLAKYWFYRQRLRDRFMVVTKNAEAKGTNIPAASIDLTNGVINWDDNNGAFNQYLAMLATEYYLLNKNGEDTSETLKELLWAMWSLERLDYGSEAVWRSGAALTSDFNGMHIRDDVSTGFWSANSSHFPVANFGSIYIGDFEHDPYEEISQDNIIHMFEAMSLVNKLVTGLQLFSANDTPIYNGPSQIYYYLTGKFIVYPWQNATMYVDFAGWAKDIVRRYVHWAQASSITYSFPHGQITNYWVLRNPVTGALVREGSSDDAGLGVCYNVGFVRTSSRLGNPQVREQDPFLIDVQNSNEVFDKIFNLGSSADVDVLWPSFANMAHIHAVDLFDDYKIRSLSTTGNGPNGFDFNQLRILRDANSQYDYEHFPLIWSALYDDNNVNFPVDGWMYQEDQGHLEPLMDRAPAGGPKTNGEHDWSADSRFTWPEKLGERASQNIEISGIDYMLLHNLYYIAFRREDFSYLSITSGYNNGTWSAGRIEASNTLPSGTNTTYIGRKSIRFLPGFQISSGAAFSSKIQGKPNNYNGGLYVKPVAGGGRIAGYDALENQDMVPKFASDEEQDQSILHQTIYVHSNNLVGKEDQLRLYPNPAGSDLNVAVYHPFEDGDVKILDIHGRELIGQKLQPGIGVVDLRGLSNGIYIVKVRIGSEEVTTKMTVLK